MLEMRHTRALNIGKYQRLIEKNSQSVSTEIFVSPHPAK